MKLQSFALQSKSSAKSKPSSNFSNGSSSGVKLGENNQEFVSEFDPSKTLTSDSKKKAVIPPKENEWRPHKKMKNIELPPLHSGNKPLDFELEDAEIVKAAESDGGMLYGLNLREANGGDGGGGGSIETIMLRQFKSDLETLPEEQGLDDYDDTPVDGFGAALLAGYGWKEGRGIGKNAKDDVKVVEYKKRSAKEGLGFMADHPGTAPKVESNEWKSDGFEVGKEVRVVRGRDMGLKGKIVKVLEDGMVVLEDDVGGRSSFRVDEIAELGSLEEEKCLRKLKELKIVESRSDRRKDDSKKSKDGDVDGGRSVRRDSRRDDSKKSKDGDDVGKSERRDSRRKRDDDVVKTRHERGEKQEKNGGGKKVMWLRSHIRVRIISKEFKRGKFHLKKGQVVDVIGPGICDISMDDGGEIVQAVDQNILETALPKRGGNVLVLLGKHKGVYGKLVEKDSEKETGVVQDADTHEMFQVGLEQIAEYLGDPSYLGY